MEMRHETLEGEITVVALCGRLDLEGTQAVDQKFSFLTTSRTGRFLIDLTEVPYIASIGIRMLLMTARSQMQRGGRIALVVPEGMSRQVLETAGIGQVVPMCVDIDSARDTIAAG